MKRNIWKTIKLGVHKNFRQYQEALKKEGFCVDYQAAEIMEGWSFRISEREVDVDLVIPSNAELGFENGTHYRNTCRRAIELGYALCEPEDGAALRLAYPEQEKWNDLFLGMEPINFHGEPVVFAILYDSVGRWFAASRIDMTKTERFLARVSDSEPYFGGESRFVFRCPSGN